MELPKCTYVGWVLADLVGQAGVAYRDEEGANDPGSIFKDQWYFIPNNAALRPAKHLNFTGYLVHAKELEFASSLESENV